MKKRFLVTRIWQHACGSRMVNPLMTFHDEADARRGVEARKGELDMLIQSALVSPDGRPLMTLRDFLFQYLGFRGIAYGIQPIEEHMGPEIVAPPEKKIIIQ